MKYLSSREIRCPTPFNLEVGLLDQLHENHLAEPAIAEVECTTLYSNTQVPFIVKVCESAALIWLNAIVVGQVPGLPLNMFLSDLVQAYRA